MVTPSPARSSEPQEFTLADFSYELPPSLIAQQPAPERAEARLMVCQRSGLGQVEHLHVTDLPEQVRGDELFVFNDTRVVPARVLGHKATGGKVELLVLRETDAQDEVLAMGRSSKSLRPGTEVILASGESAVVTEVQGGGLVRARLPLADQEGLWAFLERCGHLPLPPYIHRDSGPTAQDQERYQTVFARNPGSVAAPTAGLHFTDPLLRDLERRGCGVAHLSLHVGPGTFSPVRAERLSEHTMHTERYELPDDTASQVLQARREGRPVVAVGTTVVRTLEAVARDHGEVCPASGDTDIFITPGWGFQVVDQLFTNFHLPGSTLLMLVCAFGGHRETMARYGSAVASRYRFFSYGDGMWIR